jgi:hypothetical protein
MLPAMQDFIGESILRINQAGFGSLFLAEYPIFGEIVEEYEEGLITYQQGLEAMVESAREIYWDENYDPADNSWGIVCDKLVEAAPGRFVG